MQDKFTFPNINATTTEGQIKQLVDYLVMFKEELEFEFMGTQESINKINREIKTLSQQKE